MSSTSFVNGYARPLPTSTCLLTVRFFPCRAKRLILHILAALRDAVHRKRLVDAHLRRVHVAQLFNRIRHTSHIGVFILPVLVVLGILGTLVFLVCP